MPDWDPAVIRHRIDQLARSRGGSRVFGATGHHFKRRRCLTERKLQDVERAWSFTVPADYRRFLLEVENGGAGPGYGLFPLGTWGNERHTPPWPDGDPSMPFPHDTAWNLDLDALRPEATIQDEDAWYERRDEEYFDPALVNGSIPIAHMGCAMWVRLVVSGPRRGEVWLDDRASDAGIYPLEEVAFIDWFEGWLTQAEQAA